MITLCTLMTTEDTVFAVQNVTYFGPTAGTLSKVMRQKRKADKQARLEDAILSGRPKRNEKPHEPPGKLPLWVGGSTNPIRFAKPGTGVGKGLPKAERRRARFSVRGRYTPKVFTHREIGWDEEKNEPKLISETQWCNGRKLDPNSTVKLDG